MDKEILTKTECRLVSFYEVNFELKDFNYYNRNKFNKEKLLLDFNFDIKDIDRDAEEITIYLHNQVLYKKSKKPKDVARIYHADFISIFCVKDLKSYISEKDLNYGIKIGLFSILISISYSTMRGYLLARNQGNIISQHPLPIIVPVDLLQIKINHMLNDYIYMEEIRESEVSTK